MIRWVLSICALHIFSLLPLQADETNSVVRGCDPAIEMRANERDYLLSRIQETVTGKEVVELFIKKYGNLNNLVLQWDLVSYSQLVPNKSAARALASTSNATQQPSSTVCIHLTKKLPEIEHLADLTHELTHATKLKRETLEGNFSDADQFVHSRIAGVGGEAEAFAAECQMKHELLNDWDALCSPYAKDSTTMDTARIVDALYSGSLSASLTGEAYPIMLKKQFRSMVMRREAKKIEKIRASGIN